MKSVDSVHKMIHSQIKLISRAFGAPYTLAKFLLMGLLWSDQD